VLSSNRLPNSLENTLRAIDPKRVYGRQVLIYGNFLRFREHCKLQAHGLSRREVLCQLRIEQ